MESTPWSTLTGAELWNLVCQESVETYNIIDALGYGHTLCLFVFVFLKYAFTFSFFPPLFNSSGPNYLVEQYGLQKISLLREFCLKTGVQVDDI